MPSPHPRSRQKLPYSAVWGFKSPSLNSHLLAVTMNQTHLRLTMCLIVPLETRAIWIMFKNSSQTGQEQGFFCSLVKQHSQIEPIKITFTIRWYITRAIFSILLTSKKLHCTTVSAITPLGATWLALARGSEHLVKAPKKQCRLG